MTPTIIGTQQQPWSLWHTNTSLTPCHQGAFFHTGFPKGTLTHRLPLESLTSLALMEYPREFPEQYDAALYI